MNYKSCNVEHTSKVTFLSLLCLTVLSGFTWHEISIFLRRFWFEFYLASLEGPVPLIIRTVTIITIQIRTATVVIPLSSTVFYLSTVTTVFVIIPILGSESKAVMIIKLISCRTRIEINKHRVVNCLVSDRKITIYLAYFFHCLSCCPFFKSYRKHIEKREHRVNSDAVSLPSRKKKKTSLKWKFNFVFVFVVVVFFTAQRKKKNKVEV